MKAGGGLEVWLHSLLVLTLDGTVVVGFIPLPLYHPGKSRWYPFNRRLGLPPIQCGSLGEE